MRRFVLLLAGLALLAPCSVFAVTPDELTVGVGDGRGARLAMRFKVTMLKIDVADVDALLAPSDAARLSAVVGPSSSDAALRRRVASVLLQSTPCLIRMRFLRDASWSRFMDGTRGNLEGAVEAFVSG